MRRALSLTCLFAFSLLSHSLYAQSETAIEKLDALYARYLSVSSEEALTVYKNQKEHLYEEASKEEIEALDSILLERLFEAEESGNDDIFLKAVITFLGEARPEHPAFPSILVQVAKVYEDRKDMATVSSIIGLLKQIQEGAGTDCTEEIAIVNDIYKRMAQNQPFSEEVNGIWVSDIIFGKEEVKRAAHKGIMLDWELPKQKSRPLTVLNISNDGVFVDISRSGFVSKPMEFNGMNAAQSITLDNNSGFYQFAFADQKIKRGNYSQAAIWYDGAQDADARLTAVIKTDARDLSDVLTGVVIDAFVTASLEALAQSFATTRSWINLMTIDGQRIKPGVLSATLSYHIEKASNPSSTVVFKRTTGAYQSDPFTLYKLTPQCGVVLANKKGYPWYTYMQSFQATSELEAIRKKHGMSNPKYWLPLITGMVAGSALMYHGIRGMVNEDKNNATKAESIRNYVCYATGLGVFSLSIAIPCSISTSKKHSAIRAFNQRQLQILEDYYFE